MAAALLCAGQSQTRCSVSDAALWQLGAVPKSLVSSRKSGDIGSMLEFNATAPLAWIHGTLELHPVNAPPRFGMKGLGLLKSVFFSCNLHSSPVPSVLNSATDAGALLATRLDASRCAVERPRLYCSRLKIVLSLWRVREKNDRRSADHHQTSTYRTREICRSFLLPRMNVDTARTCSTRASRTARHVAWL